jgi:hypothetical protein
VRYFCSPVELILTEYKILLDYCAYPDKIDRLHLWVASLIKLEDNMRTKMERALSKMYAVGKSAWELERSSTCAYFKFLL